MIPLKLKHGDEIRVVAPARSLDLPWISEELKNIAAERFQNMGFKLTFGNNVMKKDEMSSSSVQERVEDLHNAFSDSNVRAIITVIGGYNSIEIIPYLDYQLIKDNPKILCGYSDITAVLNAIYTKTGLVTYYGPHYFDFGDLKSFDYTLDYFNKCLLQEDKYNLGSSKEWSDEKWGKDQQNRHFNKNNGYVCVNEGQAEGTIIGGNISTLQLLRGTEYWPANSQKYVLFIEDDSEYTIDHLNRNLVSLCLDPSYANCSGIVFGRFQIESEVTGESIKSIVLRNSKIIGNIPIIANADFGHTTPKATIPLGGSAKIVSNEKSSSIEIVEH